MSEHFQSFDSFEDMIAFMRANEEAANAALADEQRALTWGSHWVRFYDIPHRILIWGKVYTEAEMEAAERRHREGEDREQELAEAEATIAGIRENHERGYLFGMAYSVLETDGEPGDTHRANAWPISEELFEAARAANWITDDLSNEAKADLSLVYLAWGAAEYAKSGQAPRPGA